MQKIKDLQKKWQHLAAPTFFIGGFIFDIATLGRIDDSSNILIFSIYLLVSTFIFFVDLKNLNNSSELTALQPSILNIPLLPTWKIRDQTLHYWFYHYKDEIFHFTQGALLCAFTIFYFKSAQLSSSLLFMIVLLAPLLINEMGIVRKFGIIIKSFFLNLTLMSFILVYTPLPFGKVSLFIFTTSIVIYLCLVLFLAKVFQSIDISLHSIKKYWLIPAISLALLFYAFRLLKMIPPVPLSLERAGIYHKVEKHYPHYKLYHQKKWWRLWHTSDEYFQARSQDRLYFFGRIFAPKGFNDKVYIRWSKYEHEKWSTSDRIEMSILGGRDKGFRGYTYKENYTTGDWRVSVETSGGLEIGRLNFQIVPDHQKEKREFQVINDF